MFGESTGVDMLGIRERMSEVLVRVSILETEESKEEESEEGGSEKES